MADAAAGSGPIAAPTATDGPMLAADGTPLKRSLARALRREKLRALALIAPLLLFILVSFIAPIADMLFRSVENQIVSETLPRTTEALRGWDFESGEAPDEPVFAALYEDLVEAVEAKTHTRLGSRLNYETTGVSSLFRKSGRGVRRIDTDVYKDQFVAHNRAWEHPVTWGAMTDNVMIRPLLPEAAPAWDAFKAEIAEDGESLVDSKPDAALYTALYRDLLAADPAAIAEITGDTDFLVKAAHTAVADFEPLSFKEAFLDIDDDWGDPEIWGTILTFSPAYTSGYFLSSVDMQMTPAGIEEQPEDQQIYILLFQRTLFMSLVIMGSCILLGYPIAYLLASLPLRTSNVLLILVLLPFWTSLLVRTSSWKVLLQQQGVINDILVWMGLVADGDRLVMINNQFGTIVAMTHILLPFMILPLYSVMKTIPPTYVRAAKSLGATNWTAFWRVYFPQSVPGIGAGCILVFILAIGYYITPELVGGTTGTFISNRIAYHISSSLNWGLAAALGHDPSRARPGALLGLRPDRGHRQCEPRIAP